MVNVNSRKRRTEGCRKAPSLGVAGNKKVEYCSQHATNGMANVRNRKCRTEGCGEEPSFGVAGTKKKEYCAQHAQEGMVDLKNGRCNTEGCGKAPSLGVLLTARIGRNRQRLWRSTTYSTHRTGWSTSIT